MIDRLNHILIQNNALLICKNDCIDSVGLTTDQAINIICCK